MGEKQAQPKFENRQEWLKLTAEFAASNPHYTDKNGMANLYHIVSAAAQCGYDTITPENWEQVKQKLTARVAANAQVDAEQETEPDAGQDSEQTQAAPVMRTWNEAPRSANVKVAIWGREWQVTIRAETSAELAREMQAMSKWLDKAQAVNGKEHGATKTLAQPQQPVQPPQVQVAPPPAPQAATSHGGEFVCAMIEVGESFKSKKPQLKFHCSGEERPLTFTKSTNDMVALLAPLGFTSAHIAVGQKYPVNCFVRWTQEGQYKNVVSVRAA